jgi:hypothetical protein
MTGKRKHVDVSLDMKLNAIKRLLQEETIKKVAVRPWRRKREGVYLMVIMYQGVLK